MVAGEYQISALGNVTLGLARGGFKRRRRGDLSVYYLCDLFVS